MSLGALAVTILGLVCPVLGIFRPWIGFVGYAFFAILCPQWNWKWSLPGLDFQKFLAASVLLGLLFNQLSRNRVTGHLRYAVGGIIAYLALSYLSGMQTISPVKTALYLDITWKIVVMMVAGIWVIKTPFQLMFLVSALIVAQGWNAWNINQIYFERGWINVIYFKWNFLDNNTYSVSTVPIFALTLGVLLTTRNIWVRIGCSVVFILQAHQLMLLESRGTMLGALLASAIAIYWMPRSPRTLVTAFAAIIVGAALAGPPVVREFMSAFETEDKLDSSASSRYKLWSAGARILADYPLLGVGPWAGEKLVPLYYGERIKREQKALHNLFFEVGTGSGVPALIGYLTFFWLPWWKHVRMKKFLGGVPPWFRAVNLAVVCGIPGYWAASMFSSGALIEAPYLLAAIGIISLLIYESQAVPVILGSRAVAPNEQGWSAGISDPRQAPGTNSTG